MYSNKKTSKNRRSSSISKRRHVRNLRILFILILTMVVSLVVYKKVINNDNSSTSKLPEPAAQINYAPPSVEEKAKTEEQKQDILNKTPTELETAQDGKKVVKPTVTSASAKEVLAYINGIFEEGGTCTATYTKGELAISGSSKGFGNATYTSCEPINPSSPLPSQGGWTVKVSYSSPNYAGSSDAIGVND